MWAMGGSTDDTTAPGPPDAPAQPGSQVQSPTALVKQEKQQEEQQVQSPSSAAAAEADAEQFKYHQQMLYPTPGLRNYGFETDFMLYRFKVKGLMGDGTLMSDQSVPVPLLFSQVLGGGL